MNIKVFNIRLSKEHCQSDQDRMNEFLNSVEVKLTSTNFVTTGSVDYWSAVVFFEPKKVKEKTEKTIELTPEEQNRFEALRRWRSDLAAKLDMPAYIICHNSPLAVIARVNPSDTIELSQIKEFGAARASKYGDDIISVLNAL